MFNDNRCHKLGSYIRIEISLVDWKRTLWKVEEFSCLWVLMFLGSPINGGSNICRWMFFFSVTSYLNLFVMGLMLLNQYNDFTGIMIVCPFSSSMVSKTWRIWFHARQGCYILALIWLFFVYIPTPRHLFGLYPPPHISPKQFAWTSVHEIEKSLGSSHVYIHVGMYSNVGSMI